MNILFINVDTNEKILEFQPENLQKYLDIYDIVNSIEIRGNTYTVESQVVRIDPETNEHVFVIYLEEEVDYDDEQDYDDDQDYDNDQDYDDEQEPPSKMTPRTNRWGLRIRTTFK